MTDAFTVGRTPLPPRTLTSIPAKQLPSYAGSAQAAAEDVKIYLKQGHRVVVLAGDERRGKVLQDFFKDHEIPAILDPELKRLEDFPVYMADAFTVGRPPLPPKTLLSIPACALPA